MLQKTELHLTNLGPCTTVCYIQNFMVLTVGSIFHGYHSFFPGTNSIFKDGMDPFKAILCFLNKGSPNRTRQYESSKIMSTIISRWPPNIIAIQFITCCFSPTRLSFNLSLAANLSLAVFCLAGLPFNLSLAVLALQDSHSIYDLLFSALQYCHSIYRLLFSALQDCHSIYHLLFPALQDCHSIYHLLFSALQDCHSIYHLLF